jgi:hypothetical protein
VLAPRDAPAGRAFAAGVVGGPAALAAPGTVHRLRERHGHGMFSHAVGPGKEQALRHAPALDGAAEQVHETLVADGRPERHRFAQC